MKGDPSVLDEWLKTTIQKGNIIEFEYGNGFVENLSLIEKGKEEPGRDGMITFGELLNIAHETFKDKLEIHTELIKVDWEAKSALFKAKVCVMNSPDDESTQVFEAYGDATQENVGDLVKKHYIRMAETRAIARALRWATNNAKTAEEETEAGYIPEEKPSEQDMAQP